MLISKIKKGALFQNPVEAFLSIARHSLAKQLQKAVTYPEDSQHAQSCVDLSGEPGLMGYKVNTPNQIDENQIGFFPPGVATH